MQVIKKIIKYFILLFFNPIWYLQLLVPRNNKIWVFGVWYGKKYSDNAKALFEYVHNSETNIRVIWLTNNTLVKKELIEKGFECHYIWSLRGILNTLRAGNVLFSSGKQDINQFFINGANVYQLWHGSPMKKIGLDDKYAHNSISDLIKKVIFPFLFEYNVNFVLSAAKIFDKIMQSAFNIKNENNIIKAGFPRNDIFFDHDYLHPLIKELNQKFNSPFKIIYLPTFRELAGSVDLFVDYKFNEERLTHLLSKINGVFILKGHFIDNGFSLDCQNDRVINLNDTTVPDINPILKDVDLLITDYSSVYFDFLLTCKPIIFSPFDLKTYINNNRELYFNYNNITAGPKANNWMEVEKYIVSLLEEDTYISQRRKMNEIFNEYNDGKSSSALANLIKQNTDYILK